MRTQVARRPQQLVLFLFISAVVQAQVEVLPIATYSNEQGLSQNIVWSILEDGRGFIWSGTTNGLNRFDGVEFVTYESDEGENGLPGGEIRALSLGPEDALFVGTSNGLAQLNVANGGIRQIRLAGPDKDTVFEEYVTVLEFSASGNLWVGTRSGLYRLNADATSLEIVASPEFAKRSVRALAEDTESRLWVGTEEGLYRLNLNSGNTTHFTHIVDEPSSISHDVIRAIHRDVDGKIWVGTSEGLNLYDGRVGFERFYYRGSSNDLIPDNWINVIESDPQGNLWIGTRSGGLCRIDRLHRTTRIYSEEKGILPTNNVLSIFFGASDLMWIGTYKFGLARLDMKPQKFRRFRLARVGGNRTDLVQAILQDRRGGIWIGNPNGLIHHNPGRGVTQHYDASGQNAISGNLVLCLFEDDRGRIWLGTYAKGLSMIDPDTGEIRHYRHDPGNPNSLQGDTVNRIVGEPGVLWIGTRTGLHRFDNGNDRFSDITFYDPSEMSPNERRVFALTAPGPDGKMWIGCNGGLVNYDSNRQEYRLYRHDRDSTASLSHNEVTALLEVSDGSLWVGTSKGLNHMDGEGQFESFFRSDGLPHSAINGIIEDEMGDLWVSTPRGLARVSTGGEIEVFSHLDGLQSNEFTNGAVYQTERGGIYFGGIQGYNYFVPHQIKENPFKPRMAITALRIFDRDIDLPPAGEPLILTHRDSFVSFKFAALEFTSPQNNKYRYKLDGFDEDWVDSGGRRFASYSNLRGGSYRINVLGSNNDGVWADQPAYLDIVVNPPFWKTKWFMALMTLLITFTVIAALQFRVREEHRRNIELEGMAQARIADLQTTNQQLIEEARKAGIGEVTTGTLHNLGNILNSLSISTEKLIMLIRNSKTHSMSMANALLAKHGDDLQHYLTVDRRGKRLPSFYSELHRILDRETKDIQTEVFSIDEKVGLMQRAVEAELDIAQGHHHLTSIDPKELMLDALKIQAYGLQRANVNVTTQFKEVPKIHVDQYQILHVLINLIQNAIEAMQSGALEQPNELRVTVDQKGGDVVMEVTDNGMGIDDQQLAQLFSYGHTTKVTGHGFGLYSCLNSIKEMGGEIVARSEGVGTGATFSIRLPFNRVEP